MVEHSFNILFLCTGNSARSITAEAIVNHRFAGRFRAYSAGSHPKGIVQPMALDVIRAMELPTDALHSKSWNEYSAASAPTMDFVFAVCDKLAKETAPVWPGHPMFANWAVPDPVEAEGTAAERALAYRQSYVMLNRRIEIFASLPIASLSRLALQGKVDQIGRIAGPEAAKAA